MLALIDARVHHRAQERVRQHVKHAMTVIAISSPLPLCISLHCPKIASTSSSSPFSGGGAAPPSSLARSRVLVIACRPLPLPPLCSARLSAWTLIVKSSATGPPSRILACSVHRSCVEKPKVIRYRIPYASLHHCRSAIRSSERSL